jgi:tetratricopeptide (TPR) repeat protein
MTKLTALVVAVFGTVALPALAAEPQKPKAKPEEAQYLQGISDKAQDQFREGLAAALRKLPKCNPFQLLESGDCCPPGHISLGQTCARIGPNECAAVAIEAPEACKLSRCAKFVREVVEEEKDKDGKPVPELDDDGKPTGKNKTKTVDVPCPPWVDGKRDLTCELDTYDCKPEELGGRTDRWCGDWVKEVPIPPQVDAAGKPVAGAPQSMIIRCKPGSEGCLLDVRECLGDELKSGKSEGAGPCKVGEYIDMARGRCTAYKCPAHCTTPDGRCAKCGPDYQGAAEAFAAASKDDERFYEALFNQGMALERMGKYQEAIAAYEKAKEIEPKDEREKSLQLSAQAYIARAWLAQARRFTEAGEKDKAKDLRERARSVCESIRGQDPDNSMANVTLALYWLDETSAQNGLELAETFVRQALRNNREDTIALNIRGLLNLKLGKNEIARWILEEKVLAIDPANPEALANLGLSYVRLGDLPKAVAAFERAVRLAPSAISARLNLGAIYLEYLNYRGAEQQYKVARQLEPDNLEALTGYALALEGRREPKQAAELYEKVLAKDPARTAILCRLAIIYGNKPFNDDDKAVALWKRYMKEVGMPPAAAAKAELDTLRLELKKWEKPPKKAPPDWAAQKQALVAKEQAQTTLWKSVVAIQSRVDAIEQGKLLQQQAKP